MEQNKYSGYKLRFVPYAVAAALLSLAGGFTSAVPSNVVTAWGIATGATTLITLAYSVGAATMAPIMGKIADVVGRRKMLIIAMALFGGGQLLIALCPTGSLPLMLLFRFIAGTGGAGMPPVIIAFIMTEFPPEKVGGGFTFYMALSNAMVIFGPTLGGLVMEKWGWRVVMYVVVCACVVSFLIALILAKKVEVPKKSFAGFDYGGCVISLIFFAMVLCVPTFGQNNGWTSPVTLVCAVVAVVALVVLVLVEHKVKTPLLNGSFLARKQFIIPVVILFLSQGLLQACMTNTILFAIYTTGSRVLAGIATSVMYVGCTLGTVILAPLADKREPKAVEGVSLVLCALGAALQLTYSANTPLVLMCLALFLMGLGLGGSMTIIMKIVMAGVDPEKAAACNGTYNVFRDMSAPFGVAVFVPMFSALLTSGSAANVAAGMDEAASAVQASVSAMHTTAIVETLVVLVAVVVCFFLPRIYAKGEKDQGAEGQSE